MNQIDLKKIIETKQKNLFKNVPQPIVTLIVRFLQRLMHIREINEILARGKDKKGFEFIEEVFEYLDFSFLLSGKDRRKIPAEGRLVIVSNHPLGALDGLALLRAIGEVRPDVKIVVNDVLSKIENLGDLFLPYDIFTLKAQKKNIKDIEKAMSEERAVIFFPSAEVSRFGPQGIVDGKWHKGAVHFARKMEAPILPVYVKGRNSIMFYAISLLHKAFSMFMLPREIFLKRSRNITIRVGDPIPANNVKKDIVNTKTMANLLKDHVYRIGRGRKGIFKTEKTVIHPVCKALLKKELSKATLLSETSDGRKTYAVKYESGKNVIREIARLRELTFRKVQEGTGDKMDMDHYDRFYTHIVLWDDNALEIMGSYRLVVYEDIWEKSDKQSIYTETLFDYTNDFDAYMRNSVELGRSFIQYKYWKSQALDMLWKGIGLYLNSRPQARYLFGSVSISHAYPEEAIDLIVYYYNKWYRSEAQLAIAKNRYTISPEKEENLSALLNGNDFEEDYRILKGLLKNYGYAVPVLFRQYSMLVQFGGMKMVDFCVDRSFNTVDGLILIDIERMEPRKKERYHLANRGGSEKTNESVFIPPIDTQPVTV
jgi:putative hemolysin